MATVQSWGVEGKTPSIGTVTGRLFDFMSPDPEQIDFEDIAHGLSNICRFNGQTRKFYSVAQHSVLVSELCDTKDALWGLLHDAPEAYLGDVVSPIKRSGLVRPAYRAAEDRIMAAIAERFGLTMPEPSSVGLGDRLAVWLEQRDLLNVAPMKYGYVVERPDLSVLCREVIPLFPDRAKIQFLDRATELGVFGWRA